MTGQRDAVGPDRISIAHLVNPVAAQPGSDLARAQPVTFASIDRARRFCEDQCQVEVFAAAYPEDQGVAPDWVRSVEPLTRSVLDLRSFERDRKLPLLRDLVERFPRGVDLCVFTNVDIALMPHFYSLLAARYRGGVDGMVINRRSITDRWSDPSDLSHMYAELGSPHPGRDCFVFRPGAIDRFDLGDVVVGAGDVGRVFTWNIALEATRFEWLRDHHATFHLGDDRGWDRVDYYDYHDHNNDEAIEVLRRLEERHGRVRDRFPIDELLPRPAGYWRRLRHGKGHPPSSVVRQLRRVGWRLRKLFR